MDTVQEVAQLIEAWAIERGIAGFTSSLRVSDPVRGPRQSAAPRNVSEADLGNLSDPDRARLMFNATGQASDASPLSVLVDFREQIPGRVKVELPSDPLAAQEFSQTIVNKIMDEGTPRFDPRIWNRIALYVPTFVMAALWLILQVTAPLPLPAMLFGWVVVLTALVGTIALDRAGAERRDRMSTGIAGIRIRNISRAEVRLNRANLRTNLKVIGITAPISLTVGVLGTAIAFSLGLKR